MKLHRWISLVSVCALALGCERPSAAVLAPARVQPVTNEPSPPPVLQPSAQVAAEPSRDGWNTAQIHWDTFEQGIARAKAEHKPVILVFHADWCSHCHTYSHVFEDPRIVEQSKNFVMIRADVDQKPDLSERFNLDGTYVPRTFFLTPEGSPMRELAADNPRFRYFFDEHDPNSLLSGMSRALQQI